MSIANDDTVSAPAQTNDSDIAATLAQPQSEGNRDDSEKADGSKPAVETQKDPERRGERYEVVVVIKLNQEYERKIGKATIDITGEAKCLEEGALGNAREAAGDWRKQFQGHLLHELLCAGGIKWLEAGDRKALRVTHGSHIAAVEDVVPTSKQAKLVSKLMSERMVILLVGVADCNNGVDRRILLVMI